MTAARKLTLAVVRSPENGNQYEWRLLESDGTLAAKSTQTFATKREATKAGEAAVPTVQKTPPKRHWTLWPTPR